jgi:very-short-patch-repair endonuclease
LRAKSHLFEEIAEMPIDKLSALARRQGGAASLAQARALGVSDAELRKRLQQGWRRPFPGVYLAPDAVGFEARIRAVLLWAGENAVASHAAAGTLWGLEHAPEALTVTVPLERTLSHRRVGVHRGRLGPFDLDRIRGIPVTSVERTLIDLSARVSFDDLAIAAESAWRKGYASAPELAHRVGQCGTHGRKGAGKLLRILKDMQSRERPLDSALEVKLWWTLREAAVPRPVPGRELWDGEGHPMRLDFAYPRKRLALEADGYEVHSERDAFEKDAVRLSRIAAAHWRVFHVTWRQLERPAEVVARLRRALESKAQARHRALGA